MEVIKDYIKGLQQKQAMKPQKWGWLPAGKTHVPHSGLKMDDDLLTSVIQLYNISITCNAYCYVSTIRFLMHFYFQIQYMGQDLRQYVKTMYRC